MKYKKRGGKRHPRVIFSLKKSERRNFSKNAGGRYKVQQGGVYNVQRRGVYKVQGFENFSEKGRL